MTETEFQPFQPMFNDPPAAGKASSPAAGGLPPPPVHEKKARKKRGPNKAASKAHEPMPKKAKKKRKALTATKPLRNVSFSKEPRASKYTLEEALAIGGTLQSEDLKLFGQIESDLRAVPKAARTRILSAVGRVFA